MIKINFKNGASGKTPLNRTNLNKMQDNIEEATMINRIILQGNSIQEGTPSIDSEAPIESVGDNINLFNKDDVEMGYLDKTGKIHNNSTDVTSQYIEVQPNTNYIKTTGNGIACYDKNKVFISYAYSTTILTPENCAYIRITVLNENIDAEKFEKGSKATLYSPYGQGIIGITIGNETASKTKTLCVQQPFRAIGDVKDKLVKQNGVWYEEHSIYRRIFDGTEEWAFVKTNENISLYQVLLSNVNYYSGSSKELLCNMFDGYASGELWGLTVEGVCINSHKNLQIATADILNSVENWKAKLQQLYNAGTPLYVDYLLATPTLIPCTPEQVEVLNDICSSYGKGLTNITCTDEVAPVVEIVKETKETVQSENDKAIATLLARIEALEKKVQ